MVLLLLANSIESAWTHIQCIHICVMQSVLHWHTPNAFTSHGCKNCAWVHSALLCTARWTFHCHGPSSPRHLHWRANYRTKKPVRLGADEGFRLGLAGKVAGSSALGIWACSNKFAWLGIKRNFCKCVLVLAANSNIIHGHVQGCIKQRQTQDKWVTGGYSFLAHPCSELFWIISKTARRVICFGAFLCHQ